MSTSQQYLSVLFLASVAFALSACGQSDSSNADEYVPGWANESTSEAEMPEDSMSPQERRTQAEDLAWNLGECEKYDMECQSQNSNYVGQIESALGELGSYALHQMIDDYQSSYELATGADCPKTSDLGAWVNAGTTCAMPALSLNDRITDIKSELSSN